MATGQIINQRYLLQRVVRQEQYCTVYQGFDQVLQRPVAIGVPALEQIPAYRAAIRQTAQFSHPNILGIYDLIAEGNQLFMIEEFVDGDDFPTLLQSQLPPYQIVDVGVQICQALLYAGSPSRKVCHGNLTPDALVRDRRGAIHVGNFALPSDLSYFHSWSVLGGDGIVISDQSVPWGQATEGRHEDDTRAVGLLLYQLLAGRPGMVIYEPPVDGRLRFSRGVPSELCELIARAIVRQHPEHITNPETLLVHLKALAETLDPPALAAAQSANAPQDERTQMANSYAVGSGKLATPTAVRQQAAPMLENGFATNYGSESYQGQQMMIGHSGQVTAARNAHLNPYNVIERDASSQRLNLPVFLSLGVTLFIFFFIIGFFVSRVILQ